MTIIALLTPLLGIILYGIGLLTSRNSGQPIPSSIRFSSVLLLLLGPLNYLLWNLLNQWLDHIGYRSIIGYVLAAMAFIVGGILTGRWKRDKIHNGNKPEVSHVNDRPIVKEPDSDPDIYRGT